MFGLRRRTKERSEGAAAEAPSQSPIPADEKRLDLDEKRLDLDEKRLGPKYDESGKLKVTEFGAGESPKDDNTPRSPAEIVTAVAAAAARWPWLCIALTTAALFARSYLGGITAAGGETWYPVPIVGFVRSDLALATFLVGCIPFALLARRWTLLGLANLAVIAVYLPELLIPGPVPAPRQVYECYGIVFAALAIVSVALWRKPAVAPVVYVALASGLPRLPEPIRPLYSAIPTDEIPNHVINMNPDIIEHVGDAALHAEAILDFVWENREDWVKVSHARSLGYFVFGKNFNHDKAFNLKYGGPDYSLRRGYRLKRARRPGPDGKSASLEGLHGESDFRMLFPEKRKEVSEMFTAKFDSSLRDIYSGILGIPTDNVVLGDTGVLSTMENMGFPAVKVVFPSMYWHWFNNPHTDSYLYQMDYIGDKRCDKTRTRTFLIPLTEPEGAGLYFWEKDGTRHDVDYKVGNVYSFEVSVLHAIRPFPYWGGLWGGIGMMDARVTIQAFAIPCWGEGDPGPTWYITH